MFKIYYLEKDGDPFYIGKAKNTTRRRHKHYRTYGTDIKLEIIDEVEDWRYWEEYYIWLFRSWDFKLENKNFGGGGPTSYTEEQKIKMRKPRPGSGDKISKTLKERNHSKYYTEEVRNKMSKSLSGRLNPHSDECITNMKISKRKTSKRVIQYDFQGNKIREWLSKGEAADSLKEQLGLTSNVMSQIKDCILGRQKTAFGFIWKYENDNPKSYFSIIYQFDLNKKLINEFKSLKEIKNWIKTNRPGTSFDSIGSTIVKKSQQNIYKSGNNYYSINKEI